MTREEAIKLLEETSIGAMMFGDKNLVAVCYFAVSAIREQEELERGCEYCVEDSEGYRKTLGAFSITNPFHGSVWNLETSHCKPRQINFCPMCGRRLYLPKPTPQKPNS